jgi:L-threonylcarbamoyladenylate synthase
VDTAERVRASGDRPQKGAVARAVAALSGGALIIYPTDTLYAIGGRARDGSAAEAVRRAKGRDEGKPLPLVAADLDQARALCAAWPPEAAALAARFWPGPLTLVLCADPALPAQVTAGTPTVAVRVPALELTRALCRGAGALVSTSANRAGGPPPLTCEEAVAAVGEAVALVLDAGPGRGVVSTIVDLASGAPRLLRAGAVSWAEIEGVLPPRAR